MVNKFFDSFSKKNVTYKKMKNIILGLIILQFLTYLLFSQSSSEKIISKEYKNFTKKRLNNKWVKDTTEVVIVASCGDEFFRDKNSFNETIRESNPRNIKNELSYSLWNDSYHIEPMTEINKITKPSGSNCCVIYKICSEKTIPFFSKKINYEYLYSDSETDYHIMLHNSQMEYKAILYIWVLGFWIEVKQDDYTTSKNL